jgi:hypothetical protein
LCTNCTESKPTVYYEAWDFGSFNANFRQPGARNVGRTTHGGTDTHYGPGLSEKECKKMRVKGEARILLQKDRTKPSYDLIDGEPGWQKRPPRDVFVHSDPDGRCRITSGTLHTYILQEEPPQWREAGLPVYTNMYKPVSYSYETELNCCSKEFKFHGTGDFPTELDFFSPPSAGENTDNFGRAN